MTQLEDQLSSDRTMQHMTTVMFVLAESVSLISAYKWNFHPGLHFNLLAFGLPLMVAGPYAISRQGHTFLRRMSAGEINVNTQLALSRQLSTLALAAYGLFVVTMSIAGSTNN